MESIRWSTIIVLVAVGLTVADVAHAQTGTAPPARTITVLGHASRPVPADASERARARVYRRALVAALDEARLKADLVAAGLDARLGAARSVFEQTDPSIQPCGARTGTPRAGGARPQPPRRRAAPAAPRRRPPRTRGPTCPLRAGVEVTFDLR